MRPNVGTIHGNKNRDVPKNLYTARIRVGLEFEPLAKEFELEPRLRVDFLGKLRFYRCLPDFSVLPRAAWPQLPGASIILALKRNKVDISLEPVFLVLSECGEICLLSARGISREGPVSLF